MRRGWDRPDDNGDRPDWGGVGQTHGYGVVMEVIFVPVSISNLFFQFFQLGHHLPTNEVVILQL